MHTHTQKQQRREKHATKRKTKKRTRKQRDGPTPNDRNRGGHAGSPSATTASAPQWERAPALSASAASTAWRRGGTCKSASLLPRRLRVGGGLPHRRGCISADVRRGGLEALPRLPSPCGARERLITPPQLNLPILRYRGAAARSAASASAPRWGRAPAQSATAVSASRCPQGLPLYYSCLGAAVSGLGCPLRRAYIDREGGGGGLPVLVRLPLPRCGGGRLPLSLAAVCAPR